MTGTNENRLPDHRRTSNPLKAALIAAAAILGAFALAPSAAEAQGGLQAGTLACKGQGGWGAIIASKKTFTCTFVTADRKVKSQYRGTITRIGLDVGVTGETALTWLVFGPASRLGDNWVLGSLAGDYVGVGAEASLGLGLGANALVGGGKDSFALQPISIQVQTGLSLAAGVQTLKLEYVGPVS